MRINIFTAIPIGVYLNSIRKQKRGKEVDKYLDELEKELHRYWKKEDTNWRQAKNGSVEECVSLFKLVCNGGAYVGYDIINMVLYAGEFVDSYREVARKEAGKIKGKIQK